MWPNSQPEQVSFKGMMIGRMSLRRDFLFFRTRSAVERGLFGRVRSLRKPEKMASVGATRKAAGLECDSDVHFLMNSDWHIKRDD